MRIPPPLPVTAPVNKCDFKTSQKKKRRIELQISAIIKCSRRKVEKSRQMCAPIGVIDSRAVLIPLAEERRRAWYV